MTVNDYEPAVINTQAARHAAAGKHANERISLSNWLKETRAAVEESCLLHKNDKTEERQAIHLDTFPYMNCYFVAFFSDAKIAAGKWISLLAVYPTA